LSTQAETFAAKVIAVMDGDTVMVLRAGDGGTAGYSMRGLRGGQKIKIRLANIDAPEKAQSFGKQSRDSLLQMVGGKTVQIDSRAVDQYGRIVGLISVDGLNVNEEQVKRGAAWEYSHYHSDKTYVEFQRAARQEQRGLWAQANPQAPWQWRKSHPLNKSDLQTSLHGASALPAPVMLYYLECGNKRRCSQMATCDEARFYFARCGVKSLDGNHDGQPCESLCRDK
jgi:endonuclease YncB( thermonuclease family)